MRHLINSLVLLMVCSSVYGQEEEKEVKEFLTAYYSVMSERNWEEYRRFFIDSAILVTIWDPDGNNVPDLYQAGIETFIAATPEGPDSQPVFEERMTNHSVKAEGNMAIAWATYEAKFGTPDNLTRWSGKDLFTLIRFKGEWKIISLTYMSD